MFTRPARPTVVVRSAPVVLIAIAGSSAALGAGPFAASIDISSMLNGVDGFVLEGAAVNDFSGRSVSSAGDVNGDGVDDLIIGVVGADPGGRGAAGQSCVVFGATGVGAGGSIELSSLNGTNGFVLNGPDNGDASGYSVSAAGDVNGDGVDDLIIGAPFGDPGGRGGAGETYVVFGSVGLGASGSVELSALNGANGFVLNGVDASDYSGRSVSGAGDVNGDGIDDLIIGADFADPGGDALAGESYVVFGAVNLGAGGSVELSALNGANGFVLNGVDADDRSGFSVSAAGDVNDDGVDDLIIGAFGADPGGRSSAGETYVVYGGASLGASGSVDLSAVGNKRFVLNGVDASDFSGRSVGSAGDVNNDGIDDLIIGADGADPSGNSNAGETYVVFGHGSLGTGGSVNLSSLNGTNGFVLKGIDVGDYSGRSVSSAGDVNGDGVDDLIIGAFTADPDGRASAGEFYIVYGGTGLGASGSLDLSSLNGTNGFVLKGVDSLDQISIPYVGSCVSSAGDVNADGIDDLLIGAHGADPNGQSNAGESYVVFGRAPACAGDVNGDGFTNSADFNILAGNFGNAVAPNTNGDLTGDGLVNSADFNVLAGDFGCGS